MTINILKEEVRENVGVYAKEQCSIPAGMGKYIAVQKSQEIYRDVIVEAEGRTVAGLVLLEIVYRVKKKLGCIFIENHNSIPIDLQRGQTIGCMNSCIVKSEEWSQQPVSRNPDTLSVNDAEKAGRTECIAERSNAQDTRIGGASRRDAEKAGSVHSVDSKQNYETEVEKQKFIRESFNLDSNVILNKDEVLKEDVINLFLDNFEVLATHPSQSVRLMYWR